MAINSPLPVLPSPASAMVDKEGRITPEWLRFFAALVAMLKEIQAETP